MRATLRWAFADLRTHRGEALFLLLATAGIVMSLLLAAALFAYATNPWQRTFSQTRGAHVWIHTTASTDLVPLTAMEGVEATAGPYATAATILSARGTRASVELRATPSTPAVAHPLITAGHWLDPTTPDGVVLESRLARALLADPGDTLSLPDGAGRLTVVGIADTAEARYRPGEQPGLVWALPSAVPHPIGQIIGLRLTDPAETGYVVQRAATTLGGGAIGEVSTWQQARAEAQGDNRLLGQVLGLFGFGALVAAGLAVHGAIATRIRGHLRDIAVLKAVGFTPHQVVRAFLCQHIAYALLGAFGAVAATDALGSQGIGRLGDAVRLWRVLPGHTMTQLIVPAGAVLFIAATTGLAAWRAGRVPPDPGVRATAAREKLRSREARDRTVKRLPALMRHALELRVPAPLVLGLHAAFIRPARSFATAARLALPLFLITVALGAWNTLERIDQHPELIGVPTALTVHTATAPGAPDVRTVLERDPQVSAAYPGIELAALVPGQTATIALRGLGTRDAPYPYTLATGRAAQGSDEAVAGQGLLDLLNVEVGDWVRMTVGDHPQILHIVGRSIEPENAGRVISTTLDTLRENDPGLTPTLYQLSLRPDADPGSVAQRLTSTGHNRFDVHVTTNPADELSPLRRVMVGVVLVLGLIGLVEVLTAIGGMIREGERDLPAWKAIGLSPLQIAAVTTTSMGCTALAAYVPAVVLGPPLARWLIDTQGRLSGMGAGIAQGPPALVLALLGSATVLGAAALTALAAARAARRRLADTLAAVS